MAWALQTKDGKFLQRYPDCPQTYNIGQQPLTKFSSKEEAEKWHRYYVIAMQRAWQGVADMVAVEV